MPWGSLPCCTLLLAFPGHGQAGPSDTLSCCPGRPRTAALSTRGRSRPLQNAWCLEPPQSQAVFSVARAPYSHRRAWDRTSIPAPWARPLQHVCLPPLNPDLISITGQPAGTRMDSSPSWSGRWAGTSGCQAACWWAHHRGVSKEPLSVCMSPRVSVGVVREALGSGSVYPSPQPKVDKEHGQEGRWGCWEVQGCPEGHQVSTCSHRTLESLLGLGGEGGQQSLTAAVGASPPQLPQGPSVGPWQLMLSSVPGPSHLVCPVLECLPPCLPPE